MFNPSRYRILAIGKVRKSWIQEGASLYLKRLPGLEIKELRDSNQKKEAEAIRNSLNKEETIIVLNEATSSLSSVQFASRLKSFESRRLVFIIGGSDGIHTEIKEIADWEMSLSPLTFPHDLARLLLLEQLYRAQSILQGSPYHRQG